MTIKEIIVEKLKAIGADGLCNCDCGCTLDNLFPCGDVYSECMPAVRGKCGPECDICEGKPPYCMKQMKEDEPMRPELSSLKAVDKR
jgi:hypothetical protein